MNGTRSRVRRAKEYRGGWGELIPDALELIFNSLSFKEKLQVIPRVCKHWRQAVQGLKSWQKIDIDGWEPYHRQRDRTLRMLIAKSGGSFRELYISHINDDQLSLIANNAKFVQVLSINSSFITDSKLEEVAPKLSSVTAIDLSHCYRITARSLVAIGTNCGSLESFTWTVGRTSECQYKQGQAISRTMPKLKHLSIEYVDINGEIALEILSGCPKLESLNIKGCWGVGYDLKDIKWEEKYPHIHVVDVFHDYLG